jgi:hypothetical protein
MESKELKQQCIELYNRLKTIAAKPEPSERELKLAKMMIDEYEQLFRKLKTVERLEDDLKSDVQDHSDEIKLMKEQRMRIMAYNEYLKTGTVSPELLRLMPAEVVTDILKK